MRALSSDHLVIAPQPGPQWNLLSCPAEQIMYGGARGGGKSYGLALDFLKHEQLYGRAARGMVFRKELDQLEGLIETFTNVFLPFGATYQITKKRFDFASGARIELRQIQRDADAEKYQGREFTWIAIDEAGNYPNPKPLDKMWACLRSTVPGVRKRFILTSNPGGVGHNWLKDRFVDAAPPMTIFHARIDEHSSISRAFIPAKLEDNPKLTNADPNYVARLKSSGPPHLVKAWLSGDWNIVAGGMFDDVFKLDSNVIDPFPIPRGWRIDRSFDWGSSAPFSVGWWAESDGSDVCLPSGQWMSTVRGDIFRIHEWYGWNGKPNEGVRMTAEQIAQGIVEREIHWGLRNQRQTRVQPGPADTSIYDVENGVCIATDMLRPVRINGSEYTGVKWTRADKRPGSRKQGWELMRKLMIAARPKVEGIPREKPGLFVFPECVQFLRTVPTLPRDKLDPDDVDTNAEDHAGDESRYRVRHRRMQMTSTGIEG